MSTRLWYTLFLFLVWVYPTIARDLSFPIDWKVLNNPVLYYEDWAIKDFYVQERSGTFYIFFSAFFTDSNNVFRSAVAEVYTQDFKAFSKPVIIANGTEGGWIGMCSPNITPLNANSKIFYILTLNSWGDMTGKPNQLFYMLSSDLINWSAYNPLAPEVTKDVRAIDAAIAIYNNKYYLIWKSGLEDQVAQVAVSDSLDKNWKLLGTPKFVRKSNPQIQFHENFDFIYINNQWRLLSTDMLLPYLYTINGTGNADSDWLNWIDGYELLVDQAEWNSKGRANAACIADWRQFDGNFYLFYAGEDDTDSFHGRGHEKLGVSRSGDLITWKSAGQT